MEASNSEVVQECRFFKVLKDGRIEVNRHFTADPIPLSDDPVTPDPIPPSDDPVTGVRSKDVVISPDVSARIFLPKLPDPNAKLPLLFYIHGGGFCMQSPFSAQYHNYVKNLAADANVIAVSVDYGLFPKRPIPACYEDSWAALQWVASHAIGNGPDDWLNTHADFQRVFIAGDSAGGNISHTLLSRVGSVGLPGMKVLGSILVHPYFGGTSDDSLWIYMCPTNKGLMDPRLKPPAEDLARLGCEKVLVFVAEKDHLLPVGKAYVEELKKSGWRGAVKIVENREKDHCFHMFYPQDEQAVANQKRIVSFIHGE